MKIIYQAQKGYKRKTVDRLHYNISVAGHLFWIALVLSTGFQNHLLTQDNSKLVTQVQAQEQKEISIAEQIGFGTYIRDIEVEKPVNTNCTTETCQMISYIAEKFQNDADEMIAIIRTCENGLFTADRVSPLNIQKSGRRSYDVGLSQINVDENNQEEIERLKDWKYNIDQAYKKYQGRGNKFTDWTCSTVVGQRNYLGH